MPTYDYECQNCGYEYEVLQRITEDPLVSCPKCEKDTLKRLIGAGSGIIFKGSGFYSTDNKKGGSSGSSSKSASSEKSGSDSSGKDSSGSKSQSDSKTEAKT